MEPKTSKSPESVVREIKRKTRRKFNSDYKWYRRYQEGSFEALANRHRPPKQFWNAIPPWEKQRVVETALEHPEKSPRVPDTEGQRSGNQSGIHRCNGTGQVPASNQSAQRAVADGLYLV